MNISFMLGNLIAQTPVPISSGPLLHIHAVDIVILLIYLLFVLAIGFITGKGHQTSEDFFLSGRSIPAWITGLAFISANLGALEVMGMATSGYQYGMMTANFYWIAAIPAMIFMGVFMMPFYYGSKVRSVPEFLKKRYNEVARFINAIFFAVFTPAVSGISMYAMGLVFSDLLGWNFTASVALSAVVVVVYTAMGGLTASIYNEVLQFFLIVLGTAPIVIIGLIANGGGMNLWNDWHVFTQKLTGMQLSPVPGGHVLSGAHYLTTWTGTGNTSDNTMQITWPGLVLGLGFVLAFSYWCTNFLVVQRTLAAKNMNDAQRTPLIAAIPKMLFPFVVILPGILAIPLIPGLLPGNAHMPGGVAVPAGMKIDNVLPLMMGKYFPAGMLGLGLTALLASFMSGMAGNVTAFNTVFTYDLYAAYIRPNAPDKHYLNVGRIMTVVGVLISVGFAYIAEGQSSIMGYTQTIFGFVNAPLIAVFLLGMFTTFTTPWGGVFGLLFGTGAAVVHWILRTYTIHLGSASLHLTFNTDQAGNFWGAFWAFVYGAAAAIIVSLFTQKKPEKEMVGLVYQLTPKPEGEHLLPWWKKPVVLAVLVFLATLILNILFW
ncbi:MAG TPA: sodium:solute symporter family protein [Phycisphaerae bacterium]|nr:sodium:solute symporter family protein [Phycisphaerae bacterium]